MKKRLFLLVLVALLTFAFLGCQDNSETTVAGETTTVAPKDDLTIVGSLTANSLDPFTLGDSDKVVNFQVFDSLFRFGDDGSIVPGLAESWVLESDGLTYTITLRDGVTFHNGEALTVDDVIFSIDTLMAVPMNSWIQSYLSSWTKVDDHTLTIVKATPFAKILNIFADRLFIVPQDLYENNYESFSSHPVGSGAYEFVSQADDKSVTLVANPDFYLGAPAITNVTVLAPVEASAAVIKLETGEADIIANIPAAQTALITANSSLEYIETAGWAMNTLLLMGDDMADVNLRKAISYAINPENAILVANEGIGSVPTNLFSDKIVGDLDGEAVFPGYNPGQASAYLTSSNYSSAMELVITVDANGAAIAQSIQSDLAAIGITVTIEQLDTNNLFQKLMNGELDMTILQMGTQMNGVEEMLAFPTMPPFSFGMTISQARTDLIAQIQAETDPEVRATLCVQAMQLAIVETDVVPVFEPVSNVAYCNEIANVQAIWAATGVFYLNEVTPQQ